VRQAIELVEIDQDKDEVPPDTGAEIAARQQEIENLERQPDDGHDSKPEDVGQPVGDGN
jgi:hypothetical protein